MERDSVALFAFVLALLIAPVLLVEVPTLYDYPNRIAALHLIKNPAPGYVIDWRMQPNLASAALAFVLPLDAYQLGRLLVALAVTLPVVGCCLLYRAVHGHFHPWPLASSLVAYSGILAVGALNYSIGAGLALIALAGWSWLKGWPRLVVGMTACVILYFCHLMAFAIFSLVVVLHAIPDWRKLVQAAIAVLPAAILTVSVDTSYPDGSSIYGAAVHKVAALLSPFVFIGHPWEFAPAALVLAALPVVARTSFTLPILGLIVVAFLVPGTLNGVAAADWRLPGFIVLLFIATSTLRRFHLTVAVATAALLAVKLGTVSYHWLAEQPIYQEARAAFRLLPKGASIQAVQTGWSDRRAPYAHLVSLAVIEASAFVPSLFTYSGPVFASPEYRDLDKPSLETVPPSQAARHIDYLFWLHYGEPPRTESEPVMEGSFFTIYRAPAS